MGTENDSAISRPALDLRGQVLGHGLAVRLVVRVDLAAEHRGVINVEGERSVRRLERAEDVQQCHSKAADRSGWFAGRRAQVGSLHGEVGAKNQGIGVEDDDSFGLVDRIGGGFRQRRHL